MAASLINERIHSQPGISSISGQGRRVSLNQGENSQVSFSDAMNVLFAGAKETPGSKSIPALSKSQDNGAQTFNLAKVP